MPEDRQATNWWRVVWRNRHKSDTPWAIGEPAGRRFRDSLPPERPFLISFLLIFVDMVLVISAFVFLLLVILGILSFSGVISSIISGYGYVTYLAPALLFVSAAIDRILRHRQKVHAARLEDRSEVERLFLDRALENGAPSPVVSHLVKLGPEGWTEYQVLPLRQLIVERASPADLVPMARTILTDLKEYSEDAAYRYDTDLYYDWKSKIDSAIADYDRAAADKQDAERSLRSVISRATEHVIDYEMKWAEGSVMIRSLLTVVAVGSISALYYGILPLIYPDRKFGVVNWIILGAAGALMAVLQNLRNSDVTEVGNTEGRGEIWRTVSGGTLGLVAGALANGVIAAGMLTSSLVPKLPPIEPIDMGRAMIWAISAGFLVDLIINKVLKPFKSE